jgi:BirA family transcriptional regulator, biotin operon repressor / biotin---[acetyl-CoA-carboxylase] ligase
VHLRRTDSTNERARALALAGAPHGTLVSASEQTAGRGRQGRRWSAPPGSALLMSLLLRDEPSPLLALIAAVAVCDVAGSNALIKWPNDVVVVRAEGSAHAQRASVRAAASEAVLASTPEPSTREPQVVFSKLAGILAEGRPQQGWAVLGIGLNVAVRLDELPPELRHTAATLGEPPSAIEPTLERLLAALAVRLSEPVETTLDAWRARDALRGRQIAWEPHGQGEAEGIDGAGRLIVRQPGGARVALDAGEVHLRST